MILSFKSREVNTKHPLKPLKIGTFIQYSKKEIKKYKKERVYGTYLK
jgi:hypothetical protein